MQKDNTWILISDASRARIFATDGPGRPLELVQELEHPESREKNQDLVTDRPGRVQQASAPSRLGGAVGPSKGNRSAAEPQTTPKEHEHENFAREIADVLYKGVTSNACTSLVIAAPPQFLGLLRDLLDEPVRKRVSGSLDKDYTQLDLRDITERVQGLLVPKA